MNYKTKIILMLFFVSALSFGQKTKVVLADLQQKVEEYSNKLVVDEEIDHEDPLGLNAGLVWSKDKTQLAVIIKAEIYEGWRAYAYVPKTQPYIETEIQLELPEGVTKINDWIEPNKYPYSDGIYIYQGTLVFVQYCKVGNYKKGAEIEAGLYYQTCDHYKCFPPETKTKTLKL